MRLVGTTKPTIIAIKERTHWNSPSLVAQDPVTLGLCSQIDLDAEVKKAAARLARDEQASGVQSRPRSRRCSRPRRPSRFPCRREPEPPMATSLAQEARDAMAAPEEEEEVPDADSDLRQAERAEARLSLYAGPRPDAVF